MEALAVDETYLYGSGHSKVALESYAVHSRGDASVDSPRASSAFRYKMLALDISQLYTDSAVERLSNRPRGTRAFGWLAPHATLQTRGVKTSRHDHLPTSSNRTTAFPRIRNALVVSKALSGISKRPWNEDWCACRQLGIVQLKAEGTKVAKVGVSVFTQMETSLSHSSLP